MRACLNSTGPHNFGLALDQAAICLNWEQTLGKPGDNSSAEAKKCSNSLAVRLEKGYVPTATALTRKPYWRPLSASAFVNEFTAPLAAA